MYSCNFSGQCETDPQGRYSSLSTCQDDCRARDNKDSDYLSFQFIPEEASRFLAPSDQVVVLKRLTGIDATPANARHLLLALRDTATADEQLMYPELLPYLLSLNTLTSERLLEEATPRTLRFLSERYPTLTDFERRLPPETAKAQLRELMTLAIDNWLERGLTYLSAIPNDLHYSLLDAFDEAIEEDRFDPDQHQDWVLSHPSLFEATLLPWIWSGNLNLVVLAYERYPESRDLITDLMVDQGSTPTVKTYLSITGEIVPLDVIIRSGNLDLLRDSLGWNIYNHSAIEDTVASLLAEEPELLTQDVVSILLQRGITF